MDKQTVTAWLGRFVALWVLMFLAAGIPFSAVGMMYGSPSVTLAAIICASLFHMWKPREHLKTLFILYLILAIVAGLFVPNITNAG